MASASYPQDTGILTLLNFIAKCNIYHLAQKHFLFDQPFALNTVSMVVATTATILNVFFFLLLLFISLQVYSTSDFVHKYLL